MKPLEDRLAQKPVVKVPTVTIDGAIDPLKPGGTSEHARMFIAQHEHRVIHSGHNLPQQDPEAFADAVMKVRDWSTTETDPLTQRPAHPNRESPANNSIRDVTPENI